MPGTIKVTVLEFKGISSSSSSKPSIKSLKVSIGKRQFHTWDKGDFSFPIMKLREDLVVALLDAAGNEIAHADIRIMHIIEKGSWDEVFPINGCGHVHMKLQFVLSEEDRDRIRIMRESVVKKKFETNPNINHGLSETSSSSSDSVEMPKETEEKVSDLDSATSSAISLSSYQKEEETILETAIPVKESAVDTTDQGVGVPSSPSIDGVKSKSPRVHEMAPADKTQFQPPGNVRSAIKEEDSLKLSGSAISDSLSSKTQDDPIQESQSESPVVKIPSNVRKRISAFETSQLQDHMDSKQEVKSQKKTPVQSQLNRLRKGGLLDDQIPKAVVSPADESLIQHKDHSTRSLDQSPASFSRSHAIVSSGTKPPLAKELASTVTLTRAGGKDSREPTVQELEKSELDLMAQSMSEKTSSRKTEDQSQVTKAYKLSSDLVNSSESSVPEGSRIGGETGLKSSTISNIQVASNPIPKSLECYEEECSSTQSSGMWMFPDDTRCLCITTADEKVTKIVGHHHYEAKTCQMKIFSESEAQEKNLTRGTEYKMEKNQKETVELPKSGCGSSPDDSSDGPLGKVIKIIAILGFGLLVLLTRQKEPRKKKDTEETAHLFPIPNYIDETTLKP